MPGGDADLQRAIYEAVTAGSLRLVGTDGSERSVASPAEIGIGQSGVRLAKPTPPATADDTTTPTQPTSTDDTEAEPSTNTADNTSPAPDPQSKVTEKQVAFSLRTSLLQDQPRADLYALLQALADMVDDEKSSYAEVMLKVRVTSDVADDIADLVRKTGANPDVRNA